MENNAYGEKAEEALHHQAWSTGVLILTQQGSVGRLYVSIVCL